MHDENPSQVANDKLQLNKIAVESNNCSSRDEGTLYLFTNKFPHDPIAETFIEIEIKYLSDKFSHIVVMPSQYDSVEVRNVPSNVSVKCLLREYRKFELPFIFVRYLPKMMAIFSYELSHTKRPCVYVGHFISYLKIIFKNIIKYHILKKEFKNNDGAFICYDYWLVNSTIALALLKKEGIIPRFFSRSHRFDLYDNVDMPTPAFANFIIKYTSNIFPVSKNGEYELKSKLDSRFTNKIETFYLGTPIPISIPTRKNNDVFTIFSCSELVGVKRVGLIVEVLSKLQVCKPVNWIHIGDGVCMNDIKQEIKKLPSGIIVDLKGSMSNSEVLEFYQHKYIDLFINLSSSEGLPVSIMEASSYGVPVIACNVCGIPEIVNEDTGVLVDVNEDVGAIAAIIDAIIKEERVFDRIKIAELCKMKFDSNRNYIKFVNNISTIE